MCGEKGQTHVYVLCSSVNGTQENISVKCATVEKPFIALCILSLLLGNIIALSNNHMLTSKESAYVPVICWSAMKVNRMCLRLRFTYSPLLSLNVLALIWLSVKNNSSHFGLG